MTRRPGKAPSSPQKSDLTETKLPTPRTHFKRHLHLASTIHVKNHIRMRRGGDQMMEARRSTPALALRRELTAVKKVKSLQDPSTSSSFSPVSTCSSVTRRESSEVPAYERARRQARRRIAKEGKGEVGGHEVISRGWGASCDGGEYAALAEWSDRNHELFSQQRRTAATCRVEPERSWQSDAEEIARRLIAEQKGQISSPAHSYMSNLARAHGLSLLGFRDDITTSEAEDGSFLESEDGELPGVSSSHPSNSAGSPLVRSHRNRRRPSAKDHSKGINRAGLHSRPRRAVHGYKEVAVVPTMSDELDVSEIPQYGCGMPWNKYKGKSLLDYAGIGLTCAFPEPAMKKKPSNDSKQVSGASSRHGSKRDLQVPAIDSESHAVPLLSEAQNPDDELMMNAPPARETPGSQTVSSSTTTTKAASPFTCSISQKYRPKSFRDMVGHSLVVKSLTTAITKGKVAPVYVFSGPQGTGKTTCARVFAAALACLNTEPHRRPCGLCRECATITLNRSRDVKEVDVASCSDLDHIKSLLTLSPAHVHPRRQHVFIVEGCDLLGVEALSSFLKFLDEPPRHAIFILITSDAFDRLPMSATSRCQKYHFGKLKESEIVTRLQALVEKESLDVDEAALLLISSRADGSLRDAESMLDQLSLLDQTITLSMVQELAGLIPEEKLVSLLDMALAADTVNTVKGMRALLDAGTDALSLVAQLASLIANILAGTFDLRRETRKKGFFSRNMPRREEQQRLRQALKVLADCEKQLRASSDRPTWLTAALLQFAPDKSYLPSSVDTSMAPSPIAFDTLEKHPATGDQPCTPRLQPPGTGLKCARKSSYHSPSNTTSGFARDRPGRVHRSSEKDKITAAQCSDHVSDSARSSSAHRPIVGSLVLFDPVRAVGNRDFRLLPRRDMEDVWDKVLEGCRSNVLRQLLSTQGTLMALAVARDETFAVAHVEFRSPEHKARAERLRSSTCHAFQMALGCPVELKLSLECPPSMVMEEIKASHVVTKAASEPSTSCETDLNAPRLVNANDIDNDIDIDPSAESPPHGDSAPSRQQRRRKPKSRQEMLTGLAARSRRIGDARARAGSVDSRESSGLVRESKYVCFPGMECVPREYYAGGSSRWHRLGRRPSLNNRVGSGRRESHHQVDVKRVKWRCPKVKGIANVDPRRKNRKLEPRRTRTRAALCWQSPTSDKHGRQEPSQRQQPDQSRKATFCLRFVPCGRSSQTHGSPI